MTLTTRVTALFGSANSGRTSLAKRLGKKGTSSDIEFYNYSKGNITLINIDPFRYPEKLDSLIETAFMVDIPLLLIPPEGIDRYVGETAILLDIMGFDNGIIVATKQDLSGEWNSLKNAASKMLGQLSVNNYRWIGVSESDGQSISELREEIIHQFDSSTFNSELPTRVVVDHAFPVRGIGTVILGRIKQGTIKKGQSVIVQPGNHKCTVKGIQLQDVDVHEATAGDRVGLALRGLLPKNVKRGSQITVEPWLKVDTTVRGKFRAAPFAHELQEGDTIHLTLELQTVVATVQSMDKSSIQLETDKPVAKFVGMRGILYDLNAKMRVLGIITIEE